MRIDRAGIALVGATLMMVSGVLPLPDAVRSVDYETIILLFGMMVVVAYLRLSGFFDRLTNSTLGHFRTPYGLLAVTITLSGVLSAFLVNDIVCLALPPGDSLGTSPPDQSVASPDRPCHRRQYRLDGDPYRQSAEHDYRQLVAYCLLAVYRRLRTATPSDKC